jgi:hypothetical protein
MSLACRGQEFCQRRRPKKRVRGVLARGYWRTLHYAYSLEPRSTGPNDRQDGQSFERAGLLTKAVLACRAAGTWHCTELEWPSCGDAVAVVRWPGAYSMHWLG